MGRNAILSTDLTLNIVHTRITRENDDHLHKSKMNLKQHHSISLSVKTPIELQSRLNMAIEMYIYGEVNHSQSEIASIDHRAGGITIYDICV